MEVKELRKVSLVKRMTVMLVALVFLVTLVQAVPVDACRHKPIRGYMDLVFVGRLSVEGEPGHPSLLAWDGEISGGINGRMVFWNLLLEFDTPRQGWSHFKEIGRAHV